VLGDLLGRGGMAEVFAGHAVGDHGFQKPVAIKRLLPELANDEVFVERLIEEAKLLVGMQHGNIVSVLDLAREGDDVFLVMEFVDGPSLRQLIKARGSRGLSLGVATYIVQSAAAGLEFAHARPGGAVIHADISPSNLLLTTSGEVRVADFGIARREGLGHGVVEGKWAYMAPEQARGEALTPRSDVFALGVVLYELLTGQHPFGRAVTANERDEQIQVIPPRVVKPTIPPGLDAICMRALAHDPRNRYGRMQQLIDALVEERFSNGYREGASDLAQAIREVALRSDPGTPRTMHTDRPVTIQTRSLLRDVTPARRPSQPPAAPPAAEAFAPVPTAAPTRLLEAVAEPFAPVPTAAPTRLLEAVAEPFVPAMAPTTPLPAEPPPPDEFPAVPSSGAQTVARMVDQLALQQVAQAAAAMLATPALGSGLRADGTPMPPFRVAQGDMRGDELASVVGGHTLTGHGAGLAIEPRGHRWTIAVLGLAALIGVGAAIAIQLTPSAQSAERAAVVSRTVEDTAAARATAGAAGEANRRAANSEAESRSDDRDAARPAPTPRPVQPTLPDPPARQTLQDVAPGAQDPAKSPGGQGTGDASGRADSRTGDASGRNDVQVERADAADGGAGDGKADGRLGEASDAKARTHATDRRASDARADDARPGDGKTDGKTDASRSSGKRTASRDSGKRKAPGILYIEARPWSWVTVDVETRETPARFSLPPGVHIVKFYNEENGLTKYEKIVVESDKTQKFTEDMSQ